VLSDVYEDMDRFYKMRKGEKERRPDGGGSNLQIGSLEKGLKYGC